MRERIVIQRLYDFPRSYSQRKFSRLKMGHLGPTLQSPVRVHEVDQYFALSHFRDRFRFTVLTVCVHVPEYFGEKVVKIPYFERGSTSVVGPLWKVDF